GQSLHGGVPEPASPQLGQPQEEQVVPVAGQVRVGRCELDALDVVELSAQQLAAMLPELLVGRVATQLGAQHRGLELSQSEVVADVLVLVPASAAGPADVHL